MTNKMPDKEFIDLLAKAREMQFVVAESLTVSGHRVRIPPCSTRPSFEERFEHSDDGDLEVTLRVEVKHRPDLDFTTVDEFPFEDIIVDVAYRIDTPKEGLLPLYAYVIVNKPATHFLWITFKTRPQWVKKPTLNSRTKETRDYYYCPKSAAQCFRIKKKGEK